MRSVNKVILIGNLTRDPEMRQTPNGQNVATFGLATNREWVTRDGRKQTSSEFHDLVAWANLADICGKYLRKGKLVYVEGYLKTRNWETPEGIRKFKTEIVVQDLIMLDKRASSESEEGAEYVPEEESAVQNGGNGEITPAGSAEKAVKERTPRAPSSRTKTKPETPQEPQEEAASAGATAATAASAAATAAGAPVDIDQDLGL